LEGAEGGNVPQLRRETEKCKPTWEIQDGVLVKGPVYGPAGKCPTFDQMY